MDLKKLFVYVPAASEATFTTSVINVPAEAAKYANKIVFLESSHRIWVKEKFYGTDPSDMKAVWTALGIEAGTTPSGEYTVGEQKFSYANFAQWIDALKSYADAKIAAEKAEVVSAYEAADSAIISGYQGADSAIISAYKAADAALEASYTAFKNKVGAIDSLTGTLKEYIDKNDASARTEVAVSGSGISVAKTAGTDGHDIYTITADQSIWEFMGAAWAADVASVATVLDAKYPAARATGKEAGDVWSVGIGGAEADPDTTILYAWDGSAWVQIGSAQGVSGVDTTPSHGVNLTNTASVVGVTVTPGAITDGNDSVVTGGAVFNAIAEEHTAAYAYAAARAAEAEANAYAKITYEIGELDVEDAAVADQYVSSVSEENGKISVSRADVDAAKLKNFEKGTDKTAVVATDTISQAVAKLENQIDAEANRATTKEGDIVTSYERADAAINTRINNMDATYTGGEQVGGNNLFTYNLTQVDGQVTAAEVTFDKTVMHNYVADNLWETYSVS